MANYAITAYRNRGIPHAQPEEQIYEIRPDLMHKYRIRSESTAANDHIEGVIYVNKEFNSGAGLASADTFTLSIVLIDTIRELTWQGMSVTWQGEDAVW